MCIYYVCCLVYVVLLECKFYSCCVYGCIVYLEFSRYLRLFNLLVYVKIFFNYVLEFVKYFRGYVF